MHTPVSCRIPILKYFRVVKEQALNYLHIPPVYCEDEGRRHAIVEVAFGGTYFLAD